MPSLNKDGVWIPQTKEELRFGDASRGPVGSDGRLSEGVQPGLAVREPLDHESQRPAPAGTEQDCAKRLEELSDVAADAKEAVKTMSSSIDKRMYGAPEPEDSEELLLHRSVIALVAIMEAVVADRNAMQIPEEMSIGLVMHAGKDGTEVEAALVNLCNARAQRNFAFNDMLLLQTGKAPSPPGSRAASSTARAAATPADFAESSSPKSHDFYLEQLLQRERECRRRLDHSTNLASMSKSLVKEMQAQLVDALSSLEPKEDDRGLNPTAAELAGNAVAANAHSPSNVEALSMIKTLHDLTADTLNYQAPSVSNTGTDSVPISATSSGPLGQDSQDSVVLDAAQKSLVARIEASPLLPLEYRPRGESGRPISPGLGGASSRLATGFEGAAAGLEAGDVQPPVRNGDGAPDLGRRRSSNDPNVVDHYARDALMSLLMARNDRLEAFDALMLVVKERDRYTVLQLQVDRQDKEIDVRRCGWLTKQGKIVRSWKQRFFVLTPEMLRYYKTQDPAATPQGTIDLSHAFVVRRHDSTDSTPEDSEGFFSRMTGKSTPRQVTVVSEAAGSSLPTSTGSGAAGSSGSSVPAGKDQSIQHGLCIEVPGVRNYYIRCKSATERESWMEDILNVRKRLPGFGVCLDDLKIVSVIGQGGFGKVALVHKKSDEPRKGGPGGQLTTKDGQILYALKVMDKDRIRNSGLGVKAVLAEREIFEGAAHPFLVHLEFAFHTKSKLYLGLEYIPGGELLGVIRKFGCIPEKFVAIYMAEIACALDHLHGQSIIYRDLKPENVLINHDGHIKITDFGIAKSGVDETTGAKSFCGTPEYFAPEVLLLSSRKQAAKQGKAPEAHQGLRQVKDSYGTAVDYWSLGVLCFEMLTGRQPFKNQNRTVLFQAIAFRPYSIPAGTKLSLGAKDLLSQLMKKDPEYRLKTFSKFKKHEFFEAVARASMSDPEQWESWWDHILLKQVDAPYKPAIASATDVSMYTKYLAEDLRLSTVLNANGRMVDKDGKTMVGAVPTAAQLDMDASSGLDEDEDDEFLSWIYDAGKVS